MSILSEVRRRYALYRVKRMLQRIVENVFNEVWEPYQAKGFTMQQVCDAVVDAVVKTLNEIDNNGKWSAEKELL